MSLRKTMNRREFFKVAGLSSVAATLPASFNLFAAPEDYTGKFLITVQAEGGWDVTSFCDPKMNVPGELDINNWANTAETQTIGNLSYAPFADNAAFFQKYYRDILIINGVDCQTNSHTTGVLHNWSGRIAEGYPSMTALFAGQNGTSLPISYINNGGYAETGGLARYTRLENPGQLANIIFPNTARGDGNETWLPRQDYNMIQQARAQRMQLLNARGNQTAQQIRNRNNYVSAIENATILSDYAKAIRSAGTIQSPVQNGEFYSTFRRQAQLALLAMNSGVSVAADLLHWGFDTHDNHDTPHAWLIQELTQGLDYLWTYAETLGIADRLVVVTGSDFSRTPHYNETNGKDHWPIGSFMVMEKNQPWTNRTIGLTDGGHNVIPISPTSHAADNQGATIHPVHVIQELREYLQISQFAADNGFSLNPAERFGFFS